MSNFFIYLFRYLQKHRLLLWLILVSVVFFCTNGILRIQTNEDISSFLPQNDENERINYAYQHIETANQIILGISSADSLNRFNSDLLIEAVDLLVSRLEQIDTAHLKSIKYVIDQDQRQLIANFLVQNMPYFLVEDDYARIDSLISEDKIFSKLRANKLILSSPAASLVKETLIRDPLGFATPLLQGLQNFQVGNSYKLIDDYIFSASGDEATIIVTSNYPSSETRQNALLHEEIQSAIDSTIAELNGTVKVSVFSASAIAITNAQQIKRDSFITVSIAMILIVALLVYFYRNAKSILLIVTSLLFGGLFAVGLIYCIRPSISLIAIGIGSVIIGIATNYPLHFLAHIRHGYTCEQSIRHISEPLLTGNITTIGAFLSLLFISSGAMHDLGIFASLLLAGTIVFVLVFLPHFYSDRILSSVDDKNLVFNGIVSFEPEKKRWMVLLVCALTLVFAFFSRHTGFDANMHNINYMTAEQRVQLDKFTQMMFDKKQNLYCVAEGKTVDEALSAFERLQSSIDSVKNLCSSSVRQVGLGVYLPSAQEQQIRLERWRNFWSTRALRTIETVDLSAKELGFTNDAFSCLQHIIGKEYVAQTTGYFSPLIDAFGDNFIIDNENRAMVLSILYADRQDIVTLESSLNSISGNLFAFNSTSITEKLVGALSLDFDKVLYVCGLIVFFFLTISFGRIEISLLAFLPLVIGWVWILGIMGITGMNFNIVNIILATFIFGQGDDYSIFVTEGLMHEYTYGKKMLKTYKNTVLLSAFIMFIAIGSLIFAKHPAMKSLGEVTIVGMFSAVLMAYVIPPLIFKWLTSKNGGKRLMPITLWNLTKTVFAFIIFLVGSIILSFLGFILITICGPSDSHKYLYHRVICWTMRSLSKLLFQVDYNLDNRNNETFEKPSVIVCNHQSHLDLMYTLMLSPKIICLTNKWVWRCPFYGWIIRYADFLPVDDGIEKNIDKLATLIERGYSILVFPEGTRSPDCSILKFHQGAFFLAKRLNIDIVPVVSHGIGHVLPKTEFLLRKGRVDLKILDRITPDRFAQESRDTARQVRKLFEEEYQNLSKEVETTDYYYDLVLHNYIYKGRSVERNARRILKQTKGFASMVAQLPDTGEYRIESCGQGEFALMLALVKKNLRVVATDSNPELLGIAKNCASIPSNLIYK